MTAGAGAAPARLRAWLRLACAPGLGSRTALELVERFGGDPEAATAAGEAALRRAGVPAAAAAALAAGEPEPVERALAWAAARPGRHLLAFDDPRYPERLRDLADPPLVLHLAGDPEVLALPQVAVVGSRRPTPAGRETAREFARALAASGLVVTSGLALGVDGAAHEGALGAEEAGAGGLTVAVCATGLDRVYPAAHAALAARIVQGGGALVSEMPPGTPPRPGLFPRRNRIIAALAHGVLVVEAGVRSGSLITARLALELGREVMAVPGSIHNPLARGCNALIRQGAKLVETAADVLEEIAPRLGEAAARLRRHAPGEPAQPAAAPAEAGDPDYARLLAAMEETPLAVDVLVERTGLTPGEVSSMLLILELEGRVASTAGGLYARVPARDQDRKP